MSLQEIKKTHNFLLVGGDTDGIAFKKADQSEFTQEEQESLLAGLNAQMDGLIRWENDGVFPRQMVIKTKNYVLVDDKGKRKTKGSALKASMKEVALKRFVQEVIDILINDGNLDQVRTLYFRYAAQILNLKDITEWCSKKTITEKLLTSKRPQESRIRDALQGKPVQEGDKIFVFFKTDTEISLRENFNGEYDSNRLLGKLYNTLCIFETVIDIKSVPNLTLKRNKNLLSEIGV